jgi:hypothetical protein
VEQYWRDNRLNMIHEGTHGIQAMDLLGRKVRMEDGAGLQLLAAASTPPSSGCRCRSWRAMPTSWPRRCRMGAATKAAWATGNPQEALANAVPYAGLRPRGAGLDLAGRGAGRAGAGCGAVRPGPCGQMGAPATSSTTSCPDRRLAAGGAPARHDLRRAARKTRSEGRPAGRAGGAACDAGRNTLFIWRAGAVPPLSCAACCRGTNAWIT